MKCWDGWKESGDQFVSSQANNAMIEGILPARQTTERGEPEKVAIKCAHILIASTRKTVLLCGFGFSMNNWICSRLFLQPYLCFWLSKTSRSNQQLNWISATVRMSANITEMEILQNSMNLSRCDNNDTEAVFGPLEVYRYDDIYREWFLTLT